MIELPSVQVDDTLDLFNELQLQHQAVATKTKTLHDACDRLVRFPPYANHFLCLFVTYYSLWRIFIIWLVCIDGLCVCVCASFFLKNTALLLCVLNTLSRLELFLIS